MTSYNGTTDPKSLLLQSPNLTLSKPAPKRMIVGAQGEQKSGKTNFALTATPPIIYRNLDKGSESIVPRFKAAGIEIIELTYPIVTPELLGNPNAEALKIANAPVWKQFEADSEAAYALPFGTVVTDTSDEVYELIRLALFGKLQQIPQYMYGGINALMDKHFNVLPYSYDMSSIFISKMSREYVNEKSTGGRVRKGWDNLRYVTQVNLQTLRIDSPSGGSQFALHIQDCAQDPRFNNVMLTDPPGMPMTQCNFQQLMAYLHGDPLPYPDASPEAQAAAQAALQAQAAS